MLCVLLVTPDHEHNGKHEIINILRTPVATWLRNPLSIVSTHLWFPGICITHQQHLANTCFQLIAKPIIFCFHPLHNSRNFHFIITHQHLVNTCFLTPLWNPLSFVSTHFTIPGISITHLFPLKINFECQM